MNKNEFAKFKELSDNESAMDIIDLLKANQIQTNVIKTGDTFSGVFGTQDPLKIEIQVPLNDFEKARKILEQEMDINLDEVPQDYYLFNFSDEKLQSILIKSDEWGEFDYVLAKKILKSRGKEINEEEIQRYKNQRVKDLAKVDESYSSWIYWGYITSFLGGLFGVFIGWLLWKSKKTLPTGQQVFRYSERDRNHGKIMLIIGCVIFPILILLKAWSDIH